PARRPALRPRRLAPGEAGRRGGRRGAVRLRRRVAGLLLPAGARPGPATGVRPAMKIAYVTAGAGGMFCGSCMRDNTLAAALARLGHDALLVPTYTPLTTDEPDVSQRRVFLGGINVYLQEKLGLFRH